MAQEQSTQGLRYNALATIADIFNRSPMGKNEWTVPRTVLSSTNCWDAYRPLCKGEKGGGAFGKAKK